MAGELSKKDFAAWLTPAQALALASKTFDLKHVKHLILERVYAGLIPAATPTISRTKDGSRPNTIHDIVGISGNYFELLQMEDDFWLVGQVTFEIVDQTMNETITVRCFDVRLDPIAVNSWLASVPAPPPLQPRRGWQRAAPKPEQPMPSPAILPHAVPKTGVSQSYRGGRPAKSFWDDLWIEMCRQFYLGDLKPNGTQAAVEKAMLDWAEAHNHELSDSSARTAARKLITVMRAEEGKN